MLKIWQKESHYITAALIILVLSGIIFEHWVISTITVFISYIFWLYYRLARLEQWLSRGTKASEVYDDSGFMGDIIRHLYHQQKINNKRKKRIKEILRRLNRNISALPDATVLLNQQLEIEWSNEPAKYLLGINPRSDYGQKITNLFRHPKFLRYLIAPDKKDYLELDSPVHNDTTLQIKIVRFGHNQRLVTARNISDQKQLQEGLKNFVANASHELKTPLTTISGHLEMLENESGLTQSGKKSVKVAQKQSRRMRDLIQDLLLLSQVESYKLQPSEGDTISITEVMTNAMASLGLNCGQDGINCDIDDSLILKGVKSEIEGICINLIENAHKYGSSDTPKIKISWKSNSAGEYVFSVNDNGPGIDPKDLPRITERYFRGSHTTADQSSGSGLGLAIVQQAAFKHGATLSIKSQPGKGSAFSVTFPSYRAVHAQTENNPNVFDLASYQEL
jgi:two-component system, OmpR family, phosphate regulon sensor histidine kinase PhoR